MPERTIRADRLRLVVAVLATLLAVPVLVLSNLGEEAAVPDTVALTAGIGPVMTMTPQTTPGSSVAGPVALATPAMAALTAVGLDVATAPTTLAVPSAPPPDASPTPPAPPPPTASTGAADEPPAPATAREPAPAPPPSEPPPSTEPPPAPAPPPEPEPATVRQAPAPATANSAEGEASWYDYKPGSCAHRSLPFGTVVRVTNLGNGRQATCTVGDRGPFVTGRIVDLEKGVFAQLADPSAGVITVRISW